MRNTLTAGPASLLSHCAVIHSIPGDLWDLHQALAQDLCIFSLSIHLFSNPAAVIHSFIHSFDCRRFVGSTPSSCLVSRFLLIPQHAEFLFNNHIQSLISWLASIRQGFVGFALNNGLESPHLLMEIVWETHPLLAAFLDFFPAQLRNHMHAFVHFNSSIPDYGTNQ